MTVQEFLTKYNGKGIDYDGYYGFQCMDLANQYNKEVVGAPRLTGNAVDVWNTYPQTHYDRIANTPTGVPLKGDILIWSQGVGQYGHIAVFYQGDMLKFTSFDQNWPVGSICHFQPHNYNYLLGWLHPKTVPPVPQVPVGDDILLNNIKAIVDGSGDPQTKIAKIRELLK